MVNHVRLILLPIIVIILLMLVGMSVSGIARADIHDLTIQRMILYGDCVDLGLDLDPDLEFFKGAGRDTKATPPRAQGSLRIEADAFHIIRNMRFDAWFRGVDQPILDDRVIVLDWEPGGAWYEVMSLWDNDIYHLTFVRRPAINEGFDPAIIFARRLFPDCVVQVDYRYLE